MFSPTGFSRVIDENVGGVVSGGVPLMINSPLVVSVVNLLIPARLGP